MPSTVSLPPPMEYLPSGVWAKLHHGRKPRALPLDDIRTSLWQAFRHLFPPHAVALQNEHGAVLVSWSMAGDRHATSAWAAPIMLRLEPELAERLGASDEAGRAREAASHEPSLRAGLVGYDPYNSANSRVIVLG